MNYLAHLFLAGDDAELLTGNFIADEVKGSAYTRFPVNVAKGILMHRETDYYCDHHPVYLRSKRRLSVHYGKYAGIITDMFYDYFLAMGWRRFSKISLRYFCTNCYTILKEKEKVMPPQSAEVLNYMVKNDWLFSYREPEGIRKALQGISGRLKYHPPLQDAVGELIRVPEPYRDEFLDFFPLLIEHLKNFKTR